MGDMGGMITAGNKNKAKRSPNGLAGHVFACMNRVKKCHMLIKMNVVCREGQGEK